jgi:hypothetical protein
LKAFLAMDSIVELVWFLAGAALLVSLGLLVWVASLLCRNDELERELSERRHWSEDFNAGRRRKERASG